MTGAQTKKASCLKEKKKTTVGAYDAFDRLAAIFQLISWDSPLLLPRAGRKTPQTELREMLMGPEKHDKMTKFCERRSKQGQEMTIEKRRQKKKELE